MPFKIMLRVGGGALAALMLLVAVVASENVAAVPAAEPSLYSAAYLRPYKGVGPPPHSPYEGAVASTYANVVRLPGQHGPVVKAASHKTVDTPFSSAHKADVRFINDGAASPPYYHPYAAAGSYPYTPAAPVAVGPYPYAPAAPVVAAGPYTASPYPYAPAPYATGPYPYAVAAAAVGPYNPYAAPYGQAYSYGPAAHSVSHASYSGPYGAHYSYKRR